MDTTTVLQYTGLQMFFCKILPGFQQKSFLVHFQKIKLMF